MSAAASLRYREVLVKSSLLGRMNTAYVEVFDDDTTLEIRHNKQLIATLIEKDRQDFLDGKATETVIGWVFLKD